MERRSKQRCGSSRTRRPAAELSLRRNRDGDPLGLTAGTAGSNRTGCYARLAGVAWGRGPVDTFDPSAPVPSVFGPPPLVQTPFYSTGAGLSAAPARQLAIGAPAAWAAARSAVT